MKRRLLSPAQWELANAADFHRKESTELAADFLIEAKKDFLRIQNLPESFGAFRATTGDV